MDFKPNPAMAAMFKMMGVDPQQIAQEFGRTFVDMDNRAREFEARLFRIEKKLDAILGEKAEQFSPTASSGNFAISFHGEPNVPTIRNVGQNGG